MYQIGFFLLAVLAGVLPFAAPGPCTQALREGLMLCGGPLLLSLFPFLVVSSLLMQCPASDLLAVPFRPLARGIGVHSPCAARVLMIGFFGGFAPAANAAAQAVRTGQLTGREADALLPGPSATWLPGQVVTQSVTVPLPPLPGDYRLVAVLYNAADPAFPRLPLAGGGEWVQLK